MANLAPFGTKPQKCVDGSGHCLEQTNYGYWRRPDCNCQPAMCANNFVCGTTAPKQFLQGKDGLCINCDMIFGTKLELGADIECCSSCDEPDRLIPLPGCGHTICGDCVNFAYFEPNNELTAKCPVCDMVMKPAWKSS